jgi:hypothetical protein
MQIIIQIMEAITIIMTNNYSIKIYESNHKIVINITYQENNNSIYSNKSECKT